MPWSLCREAMRWSTKASSEPWPPAIAVIRAGHPPADSCRELAFTLMSLVCARMSCRELAAASVQFDAEESQVIIVDLAESVVGIPVCRTHVATRNAPVGWTLSDRRTFEQPRLIDTDSEPRRFTPMIHAGRTATFAPTVSGPERRPALRRPPSTGGFPWDDDPSDPGGVSALPVDVDADSTPMLKRAFRQP